MTEMRRTVSAFQWDQANRAKCRKHGVPLDEVEALLRGSPSIAPDLKHSTAEDRFVAIGRTEQGRPLFVAFTFPQASGEWLIRPVSARYMHAREIERYDFRGPSRLLPMGMNPPAVAATARARQRQSGTIFMRLGTNNYADQCWNCTPSARCPHQEQEPATRRLVPEERSRLQKRVCDVIAALGVANPKDLPSTNLVFARTPQNKDLERPADWVRRCWPVHQALLRKVQPHWIISLGFSSGSAYEFLAAKDKQAGRQDPIEQDGRPAAWRRRVHLDFGCGERSVGILGVAHPSDRGFANAGLGGALHYPEALNAFIRKEMRG